MPLLKFPKASVLLHPSVITLATWTSVSVLYVLHLSNLLLYDLHDVMQVFLLIVVPVLIVSFTYNILRSRFSDEAAPFVLRPAPSIEPLRHRLFQCFVGWAVCAVLETIVSGGVPLAWILTGNGKANFDYGISSVHGMVNALLLALGVAYWALYLYTDHRPFLRFPLFALLWSLILVSRGTLLVLLLEYATIYLRLRPVRIASALKLITVSFGAILLFGAIGDFRSGADAFRALAAPTEEYPDWAPSGVLWAYIYTTTPLNNLLLTMHTRTPAYNPLLFNTAATLFPTVLRNAIYGEEFAKKTQEGELQNQALTVSTAYVGPFQDMGVYGIIGFSTVAGLLCEIFWHKSGFRNIFILAVFTQALVLSLFYNLLFSLPILGQLVWFFYFTKLPKARQLQISLPGAAVTPA